MEKSYMNMDKVRPFWVGESVPGVTTYLFDVVAPGTAVLQDGRTYTAPTEAGVWALLHDSYTESNTHRSYRWVNLARGCEQLSPFEACCEEVGFI